MAENMERFEGLWTPREATERLLLKCGDSMSSPAAL